MNPTTYRVLRRVCAQYKTGIRKPFQVNGRNFSLVHDGFEPGRWVGLRFDDVQYMYNVEKLAEVTPESILNAIDMFEIRQVMNS